MHVAVPQCVGWDAWGGRPCALRQGHRHGIATVTFRADRCHYAIALARSSGVAVGPQPQLPAVREAAGVSSRTAAMCAAKCMTCGKEGQQFRCHCGESVPWCAVLPSCGAVHSSRCSTWLSAKLHHGAARSCYGDTAPVGRLCGTLSGDGGLEQRCGCGREQLGGGGQPRHMSCGGSGLACVGVSCALPSMHSNRVELRLAARSLTGNRLA